MTTTQRRVQTNFTADSSTRRVAAQWAEPEQEARVERAAPNGVPEGTAREVLSWVGTDHERAAQALTAEQTATDPRKGLVSTLQRLAAPKAPKMPKVAPQPPVAPPPPVPPAVAP